MSSAAKLRKYGRGTATVAAAALVMTSFGPAAFASWDEDAAGNNMVVGDAPAAGNNYNNGTMGTIGIVDTEAGQIPGDQDPGNVNPAPVTGETADENQGARMVWAGQKGQQIADVRLVVPNRFISGDILDLRLLDRSATEVDDGLSNKDAATLLGFSGTEGVTVEVSDPMDPRTTVNADTDATDRESATAQLRSPRTMGNTETEALGWSADANQAAASARNTRPGTKPAFTVSTNQSNKVQGSDNLRLRVDNKSTGDPNAVWVVTIKGLKVDLGENVTPGDLRIVPFLSNTKPGGDAYTASPWFYGNKKEDNAGTPSDPSDDTVREVGIYTVPAFVSPVRISSTQNEIVADGLGQTIGDITITETQGFSLTDGEYRLNISGAKIANPADMKSVKVSVGDGGTNEAVSAVTKVDDDTLSFRLSGADHSKVSKITISGLLLSATQSGELKFQLAGDAISGNDGWITTAGTSTATREASETKSKKIWPAAALLGFDQDAKTVITETGANAAQWVVPLTYTAQTPITGTVTQVNVVNSTAGGPALPAGTYTVGANGATITQDGGTLTLTRDATDNTEPFTYTGGGQSYQLSTNNNSVPSAGTKFTVNAVGNATVTANPATVLPSEPQATTVTVVDTTRAGQEIANGAVFTYANAAGTLTSNGGGVLTKVASDTTGKTYVVTTDNNDLGAPVITGDVYVLDVAIAATDNGATITMGNSGAIATSTLAAANKPTTFTLSDPAGQNNASMPNGSYTLSNTGLTLTGASGAATGLVLNRAAAVDDAATTTVNEATLWTVTTAPTTPVPGIDMSDTYTISPALNATATGDALVITGGVVNTNASTGLATTSVATTVEGLPTGNYTITDSQASLTQASTGLLATQQTDDVATTDVDETAWYRVTQAGTSGIAAGTLIKFSAPLEDDGTITVTAANQTVTGNANGVVPTGGPFSVSLASDEAPARPDSTPTLPQATYTIASDGKSITGGGLTLTEQANGQFKVTSVSTGQSAYLGDLYAVNGAAVNKGKSFSVDETGAVVAWVDVPFTATVVSGTPLPTGTYTVTAGTTAGTFDITDGDDIELVGVRNGTRFAADADNGITGTFVFTNLAVGMTFTVTGGGQIAIADRGVNQADISAIPALNQLTQLGRATSESARIGGNNRYETAAKIAERWANGDKSNVHGKVRNAIIASGENFPDALSASYLSQRMGAPILLTQRGSIPADTLEALRDRQVDKVFIVGGPAAVSNQVQSQLAELNTYKWDGGTSSSDGSLTTTGAKLQVQRISSANPQNDTRYTTNQLVNMYAAAWGGQRTIGKTVYKAGEAGKYTAIFARGDNFPDALAAGVLTSGIADGTLVRPINYSQDQALPLILTQPGELSQSAVNLIENLDVQHGLIIGSENAISDGVKKSIEDRGLTNTRLGGEDRYFTAAAVAEYAMRPAAPSSTNQYPGLGFIGNATNEAGTEFGADTDAYLANGLRFPDALTASPWLGRNTNVLNLTEGADKLSGGTTDFLTKRAADVDRVIALGLGQAVSTSVLNEANKLASSK